MNCYVSMDLMFQRGWSCVACVRAWQMRGNLLYLTGGAYVCMLLLHMLNSLDGRLNICEGRPRFFKYLFQFGRTSLILYVVYLLYVCKTPLTPLLFVFPMKYPHTTREKGQKQRPKCPRPPPSLESSRCSPRIRVLGPIPILCTSSLLSMPLVPLSFEFGHCDRDCLRIAMANTNIHSFNAGLVRREFGISM